MVCKKCGEEIYDNEKCPFCNQIQSEEITNKGGMPFVMKNCDTCGHDYASDNEE